MASIYYLMTSGIPLRYCVIATKSKYNWWSNSWRILNHFKVQESDPTDPPPCVLKEEIRSQYRCWWLRKFANPDHSSKLRTFRLFKTSFGTSSYLDFGPYYLRPALLRFRCSNHRLDIRWGGITMCLDRTDSADSARPPV